jgi:hypothetical protein
VHFTFLCWNYRYLPAFWVDSRGKTPIGT